MLQSSEPSEWTGPSQTQTRLRPEGPSGPEIKLGLAQSKRGPQRVDRAKLGPLPILSASP